VFLDKVRNPKVLSNVIDELLLETAVRKFKIKETNLVDYSKTIKLINLVYKIGGQTPMKGDREQT